MNVGEIIKKLRQESGYTQQELADLLQISKASLQKYEQNDVLNIKIATLQRLCKSLNVPPFMFVFPDYIDGTVDDLSDAYAWAEIKQFLFYYYKLNFSGREKLAEYIADLQDLERYRR